MWPSRTLRRKLGATCGNVRYWGLLAFLVGARTLLGAPDLTTRSKDAKRVRVKRQREKRRRQDHEGTAEYERQEPLLPITWTSFWTLGRPATRRGMVHLASLWGTNSVFFFMKKLLGAKGIATRNKKLLVSIYVVVCFFYVLWLFASWTFLVTTSDALFFLLSLTSIHISLRPSLGWNAKRIDPPILSRRVRLRGMPAAGADSLKCIDKTKVTIG